MPDLPHKTPLGARLPNRKWIARPRPVDNPAVRIICLPHAGAGAAVFNTCVAALPPWVELCAIRFPGRENRIDERPFEDLQTLVDDLIRALEPVLDRPFVLFGHCSGSLVAFELAHRMAAAGDLRPSHLMVSSIAAPNLRKIEWLHRLPRTAFFERVAQYGGVDPHVLDDPELMDLFEPVLRADFRLIEESRCSEGPLDIPLTAIGGRNDPFVDFADLAAWRYETTAGYSLHALDAGHFVLNEAMALTAGLIRDLERTGR